MLPTFNLFGLVLPIPILTIVAGIWISLSTAEKFCQRNGISADTLYNLVFATLISSAVTARLAFVLAYPKIFLNDPLSLISPSPGLFDPWGAAAGGVIALIVYTQRSKMTIQAVLDALTPALAVFAVAIHLSNFASGSGYGTGSSLPWAINLLGTQRHPVQLYEAAGALLLLIFLWQTWRAPVSQPGRDFILFAAASSAARLFFEFFHADSTLILGQFHLVQVIAWVIMAFSLYGLHRLDQNKISAPHPQLSENQ